MFGFVCVAEFVPPEADMHPARHHIERVEVATHGALASTAPAVVIVGAGLDGIAVRVVSNPVNDEIRHQRGSPPFSGIFGAVIAVATGDNQWIFAVPKERPGDTVLHLFGEGVVSDLASTPGAVRRIEEGRG
jgi:hypothetical protein|tara:strand:- start:372 stop:767 length:396 start_codon:yes stop_codon:yes gene_type:complete